MTELARGSVTDRPWGMTLGALGLRGLTGQLVLASSDRKQYEIAFRGGAVVGATSPLATDAAVRIAMTGGLVSSSQVADIARHLAANPQRDEIEVLAQRARLGADQAMRLRRRMIAQRAARTFAVDHGNFVVDDNITLPLVTGAALDIRAVIFMGARGVLSVARLESELAMFGSWFRLLPEAVEDLAQYGFTREHDAALAMLQAGAGVPDLCATGDPHVVRAMLYALASCSAVESDAIAAATVRQPSRPIPRPAPEPAPPQPVPSQAGQPSRQHPRATTEQQPPPPSNLDGPTIRRPPVLDGPTVMRRPNAGAGPSRRRRRRRRARATTRSTHRPSATRDRRAVLASTPMPTPRRRSRSRS